MRELTVLGLVLALGCGGVATGPAAVPPPEVSTAFRNADGSYPGTVEGVCQRAHDCGCPEARVVRGCVAQAKLALKATDGIIDVQEGLFRAIADAEQDPVIDAMADGVEVVGDLVSAGIRADLQNMAGAECSELCAAMAASHAE